MAAGVRRAVGGGYAYAGSVFVGVLLAPVLPDVFVEVFGGGSTLVDAGLRGMALAVVVLGCVLAHQAQTWLARRRARVAVLTGIGTCDVLVLPIGHRSRFRPAAQRTGVRTVPEWLVDTCHPSIVIAVTSPQITDFEALAGRGLAAAGISCMQVQLSEVSDPKSTIPEVGRTVPAKLAELDPADRTVYVDITGGNVVMSLAMLRLGAVLGAECIYLASEYKNGEPVPGTQVGRAFDPAALFRSSA